LPIAAWLLPAVVSGQPNRFEAASVKPNLSGAEASDTNSTPGRISLINVTLISVIRRAFGVQDSQILGAPAWLTSDRFDIIAVTGGGDALSDKGRQPFLQALLADRFGLKYHEETRQLRAYSLVAAKQGAKLLPSQVPGEYGMKITTEPGRQILHSTRGKLTRLIDILSRLTGVLVTDQTGLSGQYDFTLVWTPNEDTQGTGPSLFTALQDQLGLSLKPVKTAVRVIVVDHIDRPSPN
jgi:uncharacterized protein (TIGR03435 family)